jgi:F-type H+-transporting ATPase subunit delta
MNESRISVRYAKALFQSALEKDILDRVNQDMIRVKEISSLPDVKTILTNPVIRPSRKSTILHGLFEGDLHQLSMGLIDLAVKNGRERYIPSIARVFIHETKNYKGITESALTTAVKVDPEIKKQVSSLIEKLFNTRVDLKENIDESIIGGFILKVDDNYIDASVRTKLRKIRAELVSGTYERRI